MSDDKSVSLAIDDAFAGRYISGIICSYHRGCVKNVVKFAEISGLFKSLASETSFLWISKDFFVCVIFQIL